MIGADPNRSRNRILELLRNPPELDFGILSSHPIVCVEPRLERVSKGASEARPAEALEEIRAILKEGTQKLQYGCLTPAMWRRYVRFAGDRISRPSRGKQQTLIAGKGIPQGFRKINWSEESAQHWFKEVLVPQMNGRDGATAYILGEPGAGKSTLLKFLLNLNAKWLANRKMVFSRFEFFKYYTYWHDQTDRIEHSLQRYISYILLRDLVRSFQYNHHPDGTMTRVDFGPFSKWQLGNTVNEAATTSGMSGNISKEVIENIVDLIDAASGDTKLDTSMLKSINHEHRVMLANYFARRYSCEIGLIVDGLDCVSIADEQLDTKRAKVMKEIGDRSRRLTDFVLWDNGERHVTVPTSKIFVMRKSTFFFYKEFADIDRSDALQFEVGEIDAEVAMYNAVTRATDRWMERFGGQQPAQDAFEKRRSELWRATAFSMRSIGRLLQIDPEHHRIYDIFGGNLRTVFDFMERLLDWFLEEAISAGTLSLAGKSSLEEAFHFLASPDARRLLKRRNYRVMESLVYGQQPWFENALKLDRATRNVFQGPSDEETLRDNPQHLGFVDNVFNYHFKRHHPYGDHHPLLEKVRIVQLLQESTEGLSFEEIETALRKRIGYVSPNLGQTMLVIVRSELVHVELDEAGIISFQATKKGSIVVTHMAPSMSYLEHAFHRTLFPEGLVRHINDRMRSHGIESWATNSIRNLFIFLAYLKYVEDNQADGKRVPFAFRVYPSTSGRALQAVQRILWPHQRDGEPDTRWEEITTRAERLIDNTVGDWERQGFLKAPPQLVA